MSSTEQHVHTGGAMPETPGAATMRAVVRTEYGDADVMRVAQVARPKIGDQEVLVRVHAAGLDRGVWHVMTGLPYASRLAFGLRRPKRPVLGLDVAGTVAAVGPGVTRFKVGDAVYGTATGTFAEYAVAREDKLAPMPANLTSAQAAAVPVSGCTALHAVHDVGRVAAGQRVLVTGASGGVGSYAVQLAKAAGAEVTGVASAAKADLVRGLGADHVLDYRTPDWLAGRYDLIVDIAGNTALKRLRGALTPTGTLVIVGGEGAGNVLGMGRALRAMMLSPFVRQRLAMMVSSEGAADLARLTTYVEAGDVTPSVGRTYALEEAPQAMRDLVAGQVRGKAVITVRDADG